MVTGLGAGVSGHGVVRQIVVVYARRVAVGPPTLSAAATALLALTMRSIERDTKNLLQPHQSRYRCASSSQAQVDIMVSEEKKRNGEGEGAAWLRSALCVGAKRCRDRDRPCAVCDMPTLEGISPAVG